MKQRMEDLASWVALVGKASPLLPDKRWPWPMMWNGFDWLSLIPRQSEPRSSPGARSTTVTLSDISYLARTTMTTAGYCDSDLILLPLSISHLVPETLATAPPRPRRLKTAPCTDLHVRVQHQYITTVYHKLFLHPATSGKTSY